MNDISPQWLRAMGADEPPQSLKISETTYVLEIVFKHDFFAATALYRGNDAAVVMKIGRSASLFGTPMCWIGRFLRVHEGRLYQLLHDLPGVPRLRGFWGPTGIVHDFVEGRPLGRNDEVSDDFFPRLSQLLDQMHARGVAYVDLEKPENIILGDDGFPHLIDFQISWHWPAKFGGNTVLARWLLGVLQSADRYHLLKHWRRLRPDQVADLRLDVGFRPPFWIRWHRRLFRPVTLARRQILVWLGARKSIYGRSPG